MEELNISRKKTVLQRLQIPFMLAHMDHCRGIQLVGCTNKSLLSSFSRTLLIQRELSLNMLVSLLAGLLPRGILVMLAWGSCYRKEKCAMSRNGQGGIAYFQNSFT